MSNNLMSDNEKDGKDPRVQFKVDIKDPEMAEAYRRAMARARQKTQKGLFYVILEDWLLALESGKAIQPLGPPPEPPPKVKSGERLAAKKSAASR
jgi:hypothetical protein